MIELKERTETEIFPIPHFNFDATVYKPDHFPVPSHVWEKGKYWQTARIKGKIVGFRMEDEGTVEEPKIKLSLFAQEPLASKEIEEIVKKINSQFHLRQDLSEFYAKFLDDEILGPAIKRLLGMRGNEGESNLYTLLMIFIVLQNATVRRTTQMMNSLLERYGTKVRFGGKEMYAFWTPEVLARASEEELRNLKVGYRAKYLKRISQSFASGKFDEETFENLSKEGKKEELLKLYGIGPASTAYFLGYDYLETIPPWERKILSKVIFDTMVDNPVSEERLLKFFKRYGKYRGLALHYIWEDLWWRRERGEKILWLENLIRR